MATTSNANNPAINTPKTGYAGDNSGVKTPGAFKVVKMLMRNSKDTDNTKDLRNLVESFTITTELFSPVVTFTATIRDNEDFFNKFSICGQETIEIEIDPLNTGDAIKQTFFVKEYVNYTKTLDFPNIQIYSLIAISEFAYRSSLMNICRVIDKNQTVDKNIETIFKGDLGLKEFVTQSEDGLATKFEGIINIQRPLKAAEWLRSRCFEEDGSPFFLHNDVTQESKIYLSSWKSLNRGATVATFEYRQLSEKIPGTAEHTKEERSRILSMMSNIKFDRLSAANAGAYASRLNVTDYASKSYFTMDFKSKATSDWTPQRYTIKNRENVQVTTTMHDMPSVNTASVQINTAITPDGEQNSITGTLYPNISKANALIARLNEINHEIVVYGFTALNPGAKIELKVPKTLRESSRTAIELDPMVSGKFIVTVAAHIFSNGIYTNKLKLVQLGDVTTVEGTEIPILPINTTPISLNSGEASTLLENNSSPTGRGIDVQYDEFLNNNRTNRSPLGGDNTGIDLNAPSLLLDLPGDQPPPDAVPL